MPTDQAYGLKAHGSNPAEGIFGCGIDRWRQLIPLNPIATPCDDDMATAKLYGDGVLDRIKPFCVGMPRGLRAPSQALPSFCLRQIPATAALFDAGRR